MTALRTVEQVRAAGAAVGAGMPPLSQDAADEVAALLAPYPKPVPVVAAA